MASNYIIFNQVTSERIMIQHSNLDLLGNFNTIYNSSISPPYQYNLLSNYFDPVNASRFPSNSRIAPLVNPTHINTAIRQPFNATNPMPQINQFMIFDQPPQSHHYTFDRISMDNVNSDYEEESIIINKSTSLQDSSGFDNVDNHHIFNKNDPNVYFKDNDKPHDSISMQSKSSISMNAPEKIETLSRATSFMMHKITELQKSMRKIKETKYKNIIAAIRESWQNLSSQHSIDNRLIKASSESTLLSSSSWDKDKILSELDKIVIPIKENLVLLSNSPFLRDSSISRGEYAFVQHVNDLKEKILFLESLKNLFNTDAINEREVMNVQNDAKSRAMSAFNYVNEYIIKPEITLEEGFTKSQQHLTEPFSHDYLGPSASFTMAERIVSMKKQLEIKQKIIDDMEKRMNITKSMIADSMQNKDNEVLNMEDRLSRVLYENEIMHHQSKRHSDAANFVSRKLAIKDDELLETKEREKFVCKTLNVNSWEDLINKYQGCIVKNEDLEGKVKKLGDLLEDSEDEYEIIMLEIRKRFENLVEDRKSLLEDYKKLLDYIKGTENADVTIKCKADQNYEFWNVEAGKLLMSVHKRKENGCEHGTDEREDISNDSIPFELISSVEMNNIVSDGTESEY